MNLTNKKKLWKLIQEKGDDLKDKLPFHHLHPNGRNPYAHICQKIKKEFNKSYKNISDDEFNKVRIFVQNIKD